LREQRNNEIIIVEDDNTYELQSRQGKYRSIRNAKRAFNRKNALIKKHSSLHCQLPRQIKRKKCLKNRAISFQSTSRIFKYTALPTIIRIYGAFHTDSTRVWPSTSWKRSVTFCVIVLEKHSEFFSNFLQVTSIFLRFFKRNIMLERMKFFFFNWQKFYVKYENFIF